MENSLNLKWNLKFWIAVYWLGRHSHVACKRANKNLSCFKQHFGKTGVKRDTHLLTLSLIDSFCVPVFIYYMAGKQLVTKKQHQTH